MSTKCTIRYGEGFHLYQDCFDEKNVELELEGIAFEASVNEDGKSFLTVTVPISLAKKIGLISDADVLYVSPWYEDEEPEK